MGTGDRLVELEERGWAALSADGATAADFYRRVLDDAVVMVLPGGMVLTDRDQIIEAMRGQPWASFRLEEPRVLRPTADTGVVTYGVVAHREGAPQYSALMSSLYVRRGEHWKLALHQQTRAERGQGAGAGGRAAGVGG